MQKKQKQKVAGIDGCKEGWIMTVIDEEVYNVSISSNLEDLISSCGPLDLIFIDMPIGLSDRYVIRDLDKIMRDELKPNRQASVFNAPSRPALSVRDYETAKEVNRRIEGKSLSIQSWHIGNKIRELDTLLKRDEDLKKVCREAHPEICFKYLNCGIAMRYSKHEKNQKGILERLDLLARFEDAIHDHYSRFRSHFPTSAVSNDDIVDSLVLALSAKLSAQFGVHTLTGSVKRDSYDLPISLSFYKAG